MKQRKLPPWHENPKAWQAMSQEERFWLRVEKQDTDDPCWIWTGKGSLYWRDASGGMISIAPRRLAWQLERQEDAPEGRLLAGCGDARCINPDHAYMAEPKVSSGGDKRRRGAVHWNTDLTDQNVCDMRRAYRMHLATPAQLAEEYNKARSTIDSILGIGKRKTWQHVTDD